MASSVQWLACQQHRLILSSIPKKLQPIIQTKVQTIDDNRERQRRFSSTTSKIDKRKRHQLRSSRSGPVMIGRTPRSVAASKFRKGNQGSSSGNTTVSDTSSSSPQRPSDTLVNHIISGGTPCDPAPPPFELANFGEESLHTLVLLRHGESEWNKLNRYTGWCDVELTQKGKKEARDAGRLLHEYNIEIDHAFTSVLKRASFSCNMALSTAKQHWVPVTKTWRLNERHYGGTYL